MKWLHLSLTSGSSALICAGRIAQAVPSFRHWPDPTSLAIFSKIVASHAFWSYSGQRSYKQTITKSPNKLNARALRIQRVTALSIYLVPFPIVKNTIQFLLRSEEFLERPSLFQCTHLRNTPNPTHTDAPLRDTLPCIYVTISTSVHSVSTYAGKRKNSFWRERNWLRLWAIKTKKSSHLHQDFKSPRCLISKDDLLHTLNMPTLHKCVPLYINALFQIGDFSEYPSHKALGSSRNFGGKL